MTALEQFQERHGGEWVAITATDAFRSALSVCNYEKIQEIATLSDQDILERSQVILSDLRGHLRYEIALTGLHEKKTLAFGDMPPPDYPSAEEEARQEALLAAGQTEEQRGERENQILERDRSRKKRGKSK